MWGFPGTFAKKCLFNSWMLIGFSEDVSLKIANWFLQSTLNPTTCFLKECPKCFLLKNAVHRVYGALQNDPRNPFFREHKSPHFAVEICKGIKKTELQQLSFACCHSPALAMALSAALKEMMSASDPAMHRESRAACQRVAEDKVLMT